MGSKGRDGDSGKGVAQGLAQKGLQPHVSGRRYVAAVLGADCASIQDFYDVQMPRIERVLLSTVR